jgi:hypothetical protein
MILNQAKFDETLFPYRNRAMIDEHIDDIVLLDILTPEPGEFQWIQFDSDIDLDRTTLRRSIPADQ